MRNLRNHVLGGGPDTPQEGALLSTTSILFMMIICMQVVNLPENATYTVQLEENLLNTPASF